MPRRWGLKALERFQHFFVKSSRCHSLVFPRRKSNPRQIGAPPRCPDCTFPQEKLKVGASARDVRFSGFAKTLPWKLHVEPRRHFAATRKSGNRAFAYIAAPYGGFYKLNFLRKIFSSRFATEVGRGECFIEMGGPKWLPRGFNP